MVIVATNIEKATELLNTEDFARKVSECADQQAAIALFKENGVNITAEELANLGELLKAFTENDGELPDEVAEQVAGGFELSQLGSLLGAIGGLFSGLAKPITDIIKIFSGESPSGGSPSGESGEQKQAQS